MEKVFSEVNNKIEVLARCEYFLDVPDKYLEQLAHGTYLTAYEQGEGVFLDDEPALGLFIIQSGSVKLVKYSKQGRELIIRVMAEGASFNEVPVFDRGPNPVTAIALEPSKIWTVKSKAIHEVMRAYPDINHTIILNLARHLRRLVGMIEELSFYQVTNRLARLIGQLYADGRGVKNHPPLTRHEMAARLGTVREVIGRSLRELERTGAIQVNRTQIQIVDDEILQPWAQGPDP
jgi:CRP/FNR family transcriptional regulator